MNKFIWINKYINKYTKKKGNKREGKIERKQTKKKGTEKRHFYLETFYRLLCDYMHINKFWIFVFFRINDVNMAWYNFITEQNEKGKLEEKTRGRWKFRLNWRVRKIAEIFSVRKWKKQILIDKPEKKARKNNLPIWYYPSSRPLSQRHLIIFYAQTQGLELLQIHTVKKILYECIHVRFYWPWWITTLNSFFISIHQLFLESFIDKRGRVNDLANAGIQ